MTGSNSWWFANTGASFYNDAVTQSLRFDDGADAKLQRTMVTPTDPEKFTIAWWMKRGNLGGNGTIIDSGSSGANYGIIYMDTNSQLVANFVAGGGNTLILKPTMTFDDVTAWYHVMFIYDSSQSTDTNRAYFIVNGTRITSYASSTYPSQDTDSPHWNTATTHYIGNGAVAGVDDWDGYLADMYHVDGQALDASSFTETKEGVLIPKEYSGSYGNNGFHLNFKKELAATNGYSHYFSGSNIAFSHATHYDIGSSDDFTVEFFFKDDRDDAPNTLGSYASSTGPFFMVQLNGTTAFYLYTGDGAARTFTFGGNASVSTTDWNHIAIVRDSGTMVGYVNGYQTTSGTTSYSDTSSWDTGAFNIGTAFSGQPAYTGLISNVRLVVGTAVYTSNFTPSTSPLTNITNTKLLACQTTDFTKDNSSNDVTGTVSGTIVAYTDSPFTGGSPFYFDKSGEGHHFTHTNLLPSDVVLDNPENNFAVLNPLKTNGQTETYSEGNLRYSSSQTSTNPATTSTIAVSSGKWYWEVLIKAIGNTANSVGIIDVEYGMEDDSSAGYTSSSGVYSYQGAGTERSGNGNTSYGDSYTTGDIIGVMLDMDNGNVYFRKNNTLQNSGTALQGSLTTTGSGTYSSYSLVYNNGDQIYNFGQDSSFVGEKTAQGNQDGNNIGDFYYSVPSGYLALCTANLSEPTLGPNSSTQPPDHFNAYSYTADNTDNKARSGMGFQPDFLWFKDRDTSFSNGLYDSSRGANQYLSSNTQGADSGASDLMSSFDSDGFTTQNDSSSGNIWNYSSDKYVVWSWKANGGTTTTNDASATSVGTIDSVYQANTDAGFSIVTYTGTGSAGSIAHGLSAVPKFIIIKNRSDGSTNWRVYHGGTGQSDPETDYMYLNSTQALSDGVYMNDTAPTSSVFSVGTHADVNTSAKNYVAYLWAEVKGYSKFGKYTGTGSASTGPYIHLGFKPALFVAKSTGTENWIVLDNARPGYNPTGNYVYWNLGNTEGGAGSDYVDLLSNGVKIKTTGASANGDGVTFVYMAWAEMPEKYSLAF